MEYTPHLGLGYALVWWLILEVIGLLAWPAAFRLFRRLPDRGYTFARPLGLIAVNYVLWILSTLGVLHNTLGGVLLAMGIVGVVGWFFYRRVGRVDDGNLVDWMREQRAVIVAVEVVLFVAFALWTAYKAYDPDIYATEKPMEFAFLNAITRSERFPPYDPWMSGYSIAYYYFGYVMVATLARLAQVPMSFAFNLGIATLFALTVGGAFGVTYNLVCVSGRGDRKVRPPARGGKVSTAIRYGILAAVMIALMGNMEGVLEFLHANGVGVTVNEPGNVTGPFWEWIDIKGLTRNGTISDTWYPTDGWWWWRASRVVHDKGLTGEDMEVIDEFPAFSFMLSDMHPHVLAYPFVFLLIALAFNLFLSDVPTTEEWWGVYLCLGAIGFLNTWDMPTYFFLLIAAHALNRYRNRNRIMAGSEWWWEVAYRAVKLASAAVVLYLPYWLYSRPKAGAGILPNLFNVTRPAHLFLMFGPFLVALAVLLVTLLGRLHRDGRVTGRSLLRQGAYVWAGTMSFFPVLLGLVLILVLLVPSMRSSVESVLANPQVRQFLGPQTFGSLLRVSLRIRLGLLPPQLRAVRVPAGPWTFLILSSLIAGVVLSLLVLLDRKPAKGKGRQRGRLPSSGLVFALLMAFAGLMLVFSVEFVYLRDAFGTRMNTVFKFYFQAWALLGLAAVFAVYYLLEQGMEGVVSRLLFGGTMSVLLGAGLLYPLGMSISRTNGFSGPPTLDGMAFVARERPEEYAAQSWLNHNVPGHPVIVEAVRGSFAYEYARVSSRTGLPTIMGWTGHEQQWHGLGEEIARREQDVKALYGGSVQDAMRVMQEYDVSFVYVGYLERSEFGNALLKFERFMDVAFRQGDTVIYRRR